MLRSLLDIGRIVLIGLAIIAVSGVIGTFAGETVGNLVFVLLAITAFFFERHAARQRRRRAIATEHLRPCPFCGTGWLHIEIGSGVAQTHDRRTAWYHMWRCNTCNHWEMGDLQGNRMPQPPQ